MEITIFTPTYNRAYILPKLYDSLCRQTCQDFCWLIVDDGSTDDTESLVRRWIDESRIRIRYYKQENAGKMEAHNRGVELCDTPLFACVDSDDHMTDRAVEDILKFWHENYDPATDTDICGMMAYRYIIMSPGAEPVIPYRFPTVRACRFKDLALKYKLWIETIIVFRTEIIKKYRFPRFEGEKFITEGALYDLIEKDYQFLLCDDAFVVCEYLADGYTHNTVKLYKEHPKGWAFYYNQNVALWRSELGLFDILRRLSRYIIMSRLAGEKNIYKNSADRSYRYLLAWLLCPWIKRKMGL